MDGQLRKISRVGIKRGEGFADILKAEVIQ